MIIPNRTIESVLSDLNKLYPNQKVGILVEFNPTFGHNRYSIHLPDGTGITSDSLEECLGIVPLEIKAR